MENTSDVVTCEKCGESVHESCNGYVKLKANENYLCDFCASGAPENMRRCVLCPSLSGPLKKSTTNKWAHTLCCVYIPQIKFKNLKTMRPVVLGGIDKNSYGKSCSICDKKEGVVIKCTVTGCSAEFHVTCAAKFGKLVETEKNFGGYCQTHYISSFISLKVSNRRVLSV